MAFAIQIKRSALRRLEKLDERRKGAVRAAIDILKEDPVPFRLLDVVKLKGYDNAYRLRIGDLRVTYGVKWNERRILIHYIGPRGGAYG